MTLVTAPLIDAQLFQRWGHEVSGWFTSPYELEERSGVFVIATEGFQVPFVLDVGESENLRLTVLHHDRRVFWRRNALGGLFYAALYIENGDSPFLSGFHRQNIEQRIRSMEQPVFGEHELFARPEYQQ